MKANTTQTNLHYFDYYLFVPYVLLCGIGIVMVYSASSINLSYANIASNTYLKKQAIYVFIGLFLLLYFALGNYWEKLKQIDRLIIGLLVILVAQLAALLFFPAVNGAKGWINLGVISLQPAEFAKLMFVFSYAYYLANRKEKLLAQGYIGHPPFKHGMGLITLAILFLIFKSPDLGGFTINLMIILVMYLASGSVHRHAIKWTTAWIVSFVTLFSLAKICYPLYKNTSYGYTYLRLVAFINPFHYAQGAGKQLINSYYAISNGGLLGVGIGNSVQKRGYLPEPYTDFILSVISEELGAIGASVIVLLIAWLVLRTFMIGIRSKNLYEALVCYGIGTFIGVESLFNIGGVLGLLPITGVTLPFISYGGSSMIVLSVALGVVMNISARQAATRVK